MFRLWCFLIGYPFGSFLTACVVSRHAAGRSPFEFGSGNPGMANVAHVLGVRAGVAVLAGDILKTLLACLLTWLIFPGHWILTVLYTGLGVVIGHNFPFWHHFHGGKGVAVSCSAIILALGFPGILANIAGLILVLLTGYLPVGAIVIPALAAAAALLLHLKEACFILCLYSLMMLQRHWSGLVSIRKGTCRKAKPFAFLKRKHQRGNS